VLQARSSLATISLPMAEYDQLLENIGKLLEVEREQTRKLVREEMEAEGKRITRDQASKYLNLDVSLHEVRDAVKSVEISNSRLEQRMDGVEKGLAQTNKAVLQIKTVVETTEETVNNMDAGLTEVVKDHRERIKQLEEQTRTTSHKN